ncbi:MAG: ABC transporter permease subunit [Collinsella sp.]
MEYARRGSRFVRLVRVTAETLQGIPSIIYGLFGMLFFVTACGWGLSLLSGACTLAIMVLPVIMRTTEEALMAVPDSYREGGFGLGAGPVAHGGLLRAALGSARHFGRRHFGSRPLCGRGGGARCSPPAPWPKSRLRRPGHLRPLRLLPHPGRAHVHPGLRGPARERGLRHLGGAADPRASAERRHARGGTENGSEARND